MVFAGVPYSAQGLLFMNELTGATPYGTSTSVGAQGERMPSNNELSVARGQGRHGAELARKLARGKSGNRYVLSPRAEAE